MAICADLVADQVDPVAAVLAERGKLYDLRRATKRARAHVPNPAAARGAFDQAAAGRPLDPAVGAWLRWRLFGLGVRLGDLGRLLDNGATVEFADALGRHVLDGRRAVSAGELARIRDMLERLEEAEAARARAAKARGARDGIGADAVGVLVERLGRPAHRQRERVDGEVVGLVMVAPLREEPKLTFRGDPLAFVVKSAGRDTAALFLP